MNGDANGHAEPNLPSTFKAHPQPEILKDLVREYRTKAITHLQESMPQKIKTIKQIIDREGHSFSPMHPSHILNDDLWKPKLLQPTDPALAELGIKDLVLPEDIVRGKYDSPDDVPETMAVYGDMDSNSDPRKGVRTGPHWFEVVPKNETQSQFVQEAMKEYEDLHAIMHDLKIWLDLEIPVIEDGNSFGAEVQMHLNREIGEALKRANGFHHAARAHHIDRIKLASDWAKFPNLMDYPTAIAASDRFDHHLLRSYLRALLGIYGGLMTKFERNWEKVIHPKGSNSSGNAMY